MRPKLSISDANLFRENIHYPSPISETSPARYVDSDGHLTVAGRAVLHRGGVDFPDGNRLTFEAADIEKMEVLGEGQYGTVFKSMHKPTNTPMGNLFCHRKKSLSHLCGRGKSCQRDSSHARSIDFESNFDGARCLVSF